MPSVAQRCCGVDPEDRLSLNISSVIFTKGFSINSTPEKKLHHFISHRAQPF